jgi:hypothetical protein
LQQDAGGHAGFGGGQGLQLLLFESPNTDVATRSEATIHGFVFVKLSIFALHFGQNVV